MASRLLLKGSSSLKKIVNTVLGRNYPYGRMQSRLNKFAVEGGEVISKVLPEIDICLLALNRLEDTKRTIKSLYRTTVPFHLIIIEQNSDDGTKEFLKDFAKQKSNVDLIFSKENLGVSGGRALAMNYSKTGYMAFIDNDMVFMPGYFENLVSTLELAPEYSGTLGKVVFPTGKIQLNHPSLIYNNDWVIFKDLDADKDFDDTSTLKQVECDWLPGVALWRTKVLKETKIDSNFQGAYEDNDYSYRLKELGHKFINCPKAIVLHISAQFTPTALQQKAYTTGRFDPDKLRNAIKYFYKIHGKYLAFGDIEGSSKYLGFKDSKDLIRFVKE